MSKRLKTVTKIISLILTVIMILEVSPTSALAAFVTNISGNADSTVADTYDESRNFYYDYHSIDVGRAGTLRINDYTLTPSLSFDALGIDGNIFPVDISMNYNSSEYRFLKEIVGYTPTAYGKGWLTNYSSMLCELQYEDKTQLAYLSGAGAVILFEQTELAETDTDLPEGTTKWVMPDLDDSYVYVYKVTDAVANADATLAQYTMHTDGATRVFDKYGRLISCVNTEVSTSNTIHYQYNDGTNLEDIAEIIDGVGNEYRFTYTDGLLTKIKCYNSAGNAIIVGDGENAAPLEMNFTYTSGNLATVTFPDGKSVNYDYNSAGNMLRATNINGYKAEITYTDGYASKLSEYARGENNAYVEGSYVNIAWNGNTRTFTDDKGEVQIKTFDDTGKILTIVDGDGNYLYGEPVAEEESSTGVVEEESSVIIPEEESSEYFVSACPCSDCTEWACECECESEEVCTCIQCKRYSDTIEDTSGNVLSEENFDGVRTMKTQNTYTSDGNHLASSVDTSGNIVYYIYDEAGFMQSMTSGDMEVFFDYDAMGNLTKLYQQVSGLSNGTTMSNIYTYTDDKVTSITHNGFSYNFTYDEWGNMTSVKIGERVYYSNEYGGENNDRLSKVNYSNGHSVTYSYDTNDNITGISYDNGVTNAFAYEYDSNNNLTKITDNSTGYITTFSNTGFETKTADERLIYSTLTNTNGTVTENLLGSAITYTFNSDYNQVTGKTVSEKNFTKNTSVINDDNIAVDTQVDYDTSVTTDWFGRTEEKGIAVATDRTTDGVLSEHYVSGETIFTYADTDTIASTRVLSQTSTFTSALHNHSRTDYYEYDATGNITGIYRYIDGVKTYYYTYVYDEAGQLVRENILEDNKTIKYLYDIGGNIVSKTVYAYTLGEITAEMTPIEVSNFGYNYSECKDALTDFSYTNTGSSSGNINSGIVSDNMGNVIEFNGVEFEWKAGRQLSSVIDGNEESKHYYNSDGMLIRVENYINNVLEDITYYTWDGDRLIGRTIEKDNNESITSRVIYDADGEAIGFIAEAPILLDYDITFLYRKNLQGDITGIIDENGEMWVEFTYDAYGLPQIHVPGAPDNTIAQAVQASIGLMLTPQLYRGYVYAAVGDMYTYYLGSRYYVPQLCRFFNADKHSDTQTGVLATNMFAYCNNNPVMYTDPTGEAISVGWIVAISTLITAIVGALVGYSIVKKNGYTVRDGWEFWKYILGGIVIGGVVGSILGYVGGSFFSASGFLYNSVTGASAATMEAVRRLGALGERLAGIIKNTTRIPSATGTANYRIPDVLDSANKIIGEVKYVNSLSFTAQLEDFYRYSKEMGYQFILYIKPETKLSSTLKGLIEAGEIIVFFITKN